MHQLCWIVVGLLAMLGLTACQAPMAPAPIGPHKGPEGSEPLRVPLPAPILERPAQATVSLGGYRTQAVVNAYTLASIDHLRLRLLRRDAQGNYVSTGVTRTIAPAELARPVSLGNLKLGAAYRVQADAYADAAEATLISDAARSRTDFAMPSLTTASGIATVDDTPISLALNVRLSDRTYAGGGTFSVDVHSAFRNRADTLRVSLYQIEAAGATLKFRKTVAWTGGTPSFTMANMKAGARYMLLAEALKGEEKLSDDTRSTLSFTLPAPGEGTLDDDLNALLGALMVPCVQAPAGVPKG